MIASSCDKRLVGDVSTLTCRNVSSGSQSWRYLSCQASTDLGEDLLELRESVETTFANHSPR